MWKMKQGEKVGEGKACVLPPEALDLPFGKLRPTSGQSHVLFPHLYSMNFG